MNLTTETKVGVLVLAGAVGLGWLTMQTGSLQTTTSLTGSRIIESSFDDVDGLKMGSKVKVAGLQVGEITDIHLGKDALATITMSIDDEVPLPANVKAQVVTSGIIGEKFVALTTDFDPEGELPESVVKIPSIGTASVDDIAGNFAKISDDLEQVTSALRSSLGGNDNAKRLDRIVSNLDSISTRLDTVLNDEVPAGSVADIVRNMNEFTEKLNNDSGNMIADLREAAASLNKILASNEEHAGQMVNNISQAANNLVVITDKLAKGEGFLGKLLTEDSDALESFDMAMKDIQEAAEKINRGEGTIGKLINDPTTAEKIDGALDSFSELTGRMESFRTEVDFRGYSLTAEDVAKGQFNITFRPRPTRYYVVGITADGFASESDDIRTNTSFYNQDFGEDIKITAQFGHVFENVAFNKDLGFRIGVKDSTFGIGADVNLWDNFVDVSADLYDFSCTNCGVASNDNPHLDLTARVNIIDRTIYAIGGYDNVLNQEIGSPFIGIGFSFQDDDLKYMLGQAL